MKRIVTIEDGYARDAQVFTGDPKTLESDCDWGNNYADMKYTTQYLGIYDGDSEDEIKSNAAKREGVHPNILTLTDFDPELGMYLLLSRDNIKIDWEFTHKENEVIVYIEVWFDPERKFGITMIGDDSINVYAYISRKDVRMTYVIKHADGTAEDEKVYEILTDAEKSLIREMANEVSLETSGKTLLELLEECNG